MASKGGEDERKRNRSFHTSRKVRVLVKSGTRAASSRTLYRSGCAAGPPNRLRWGFHSE